MYKCDAFDVIATIGLHVFQSQRDVFLFSAVKLTSTLQSESILMMTSHRSPWDDLVDAII